MKKIFTLFLALVATTALWAEDFVVDGIYYNILADKTNEVEVTFRDWNYDSYSNEYSGSVTIPSTVTYNGITYSVTSIGDQAFYDCYNLTSVTIPNSVTSIGDWAFDGCSGLTSITIPNSVTSIGDEAFDGCSGLTSVIWNAENCADFSSYDKSPFYSICSQIKSFSFGNNVRHIPAYLCYGMSNLTSINIPNGITDIRYQTFSGCSALTSITIPSSLRSLHSYEFRYCSELKSITFTATTVEEYCKSNVNSLFSLVYIRPYTISCSLLVAGEEVKDLIIPNTVDTIQDYAFLNFLNLNSITISENVNHIGKWAFYNCDSVTSIVWNVEEYADFEESPFGYVWYWSTDTKDPVHAGPSWHNFSITFGENVKRIPNRICYGCSGLQSVTTLANTPPILGQDALNATPDAYRPPLLIIYVPCGKTAIYEQEWGIPYDYYNGRYYWWYAEFPREFNITVSSQNETMGSARVDFNTFCSGAQISATANYGYHFTQWSDGNTDNPRTLELTQDTILTAEFAQSFSGQCGDNLYWSYDETTKTISITGSGDMYDYTQSTQPWLLFQEQITEVTTSNTTTGIGTSAFEGCVRLAKVSLGSGMVNIAANAFAGCTRLYDIYTYATDPPFADESSFANYNVYVYVPCEYKRSYTLDVVWGKFKFIECIESEDATTDGNVTVDPGFNDVTITWPTDENANTYSIVITKDGEVFCSLTFNSNGQLMSIAFAPGREGNHPVQYAEAAANGYRFTVTGLEEGTKYGYNLDVKDSAKQPIQSYSGEFRTQSVNDRTVTVEYNALQGQVTGAGTYLVGDTVTLTATANEGYKFIKWSDGDVNAQKTLIVTSNTTLVATFEEIQCKLTLVVNDPTMGSVFGDGTYKYGTEVSINAIPNTGYQFVQWSDNNSNSQRTLVMTSDLSLTAYFQAIKYIISATANNDNLGVVYGGGEYAYNTSVSLMAVPNAGAEFVTWTNGVVSNPYIFNAIENLSIQAIFRSTATGVEDIEVQKNSITKLLRNGQLVIVRDGVEYNAQGQIVKE